MFFNNGNGLYFGTEKLDNDVAEFELVFLKSQNSTSRTGKMDSILPSVYKFPIKIALFMASSDITNVGHTMLTCFFYTYTLRNIKNSIFELTVF